MIPVFFKVEPDKQLTVYLREARTTSEKDDDAIVDVNHDGRWIRGLELLGGGDFDLARAVKPFHPKRPSEAGRMGVTYDEEANAAFFYFSMKALSTAPGIDTPDFKYSHSITPDARFGFDDEGGLVWVRFRPEEANASVQDFVSLIEAPVDDTEIG
jgi:uncharacterized protein YuzE